MTFGCLYSGSWLHEQNWSMDDTSKQIDESNDELLRLVKHHVEEVLYKHFLKHGIKAGYELRDDAIHHVVNLAHKKGNNPHFQQFKGQYIRYMVKSYLFGYGIDSRFKKENDLEHPE